jgi:hypothetical protein
MWFPSGLSLRYSALPELGRIDGLKAAKRAPVMVVIATLNCLAKRSHAPKTG